MAQVLETVIAINAKTGNGFSQIGSTLAELSSIVSGMSDNLINFGKESVDVYRNYEKSMSSAEVALSTTYGRNTTELAGVMDSLDQKATEWAATTIFHTNDVADAISEAAHAGWDAEKITTGIPEAMQLAQAGSLDLSDAVNYVVKSTTAAGVDFQDLTKFIDEWTFAANSSASTVGEFGDAMLRMGGTMKFAGDPEELMTLLATTANAGTVGEEAGTMIRNSMLRLVAPTKKAKEAMQELGATSDESAALLNDESLAAANAELAAHGFSAYDENGNLKPVLDTYRELYVALGDIAGGYENISKNEDALNILYSIFPTRTIAEALALLQGASDNYDDLYDKMKNGDAKGYGKYAAETMMDTLDGHIETFNSKVEHLKQVVGKELAPQISDVLEGFGGIVDDFADMDEDKMEVLIKGLEGIAISGPGFAAASAAFRLIGNAISSPASMIGMTAVAIGSVTAAIAELNEQDYESHFGNMSLDTQALDNYTSTIGTDFDNAYSKVDSFRQAFDDAKSSYETAASTFSGDLFTQAVTGAELTEPEKTKLMNLGVDMQGYVIDGITNATAASMSALEALFGGEDEAEYDPEYQNIISVLNTAYNQNVADVTEIGEKLKKQLTAAFKDGKIDDDEYANILSTVQDLNKKIAQAEKEAKDEETYVETQKLLKDAQTAGITDTEEYAAKIEKQRDEKLQSAQDEFDHDYYTVEYSYKNAMENGTKVNINGETRVPTQTDLDNAQKAMKEQFAQQQSSINSEYSSYLYRLYNDTIGVSDYGDTWSGLGDLADNLIQGKETFDEAYSRLVSNYGVNAYSEKDKQSAVENTPFYGNPIATGIAFSADNQKSDRSEIASYTAQMIEALGGREQIQTDIETLTNNGNSTDAANLQRLLVMDALNNGDTSLNFKKTSDNKVDFDYKNNGLIGGTLKGIGSVAQWLGGRGLSLLQNGTTRSYLTYDTDNPAQGIVNKYTTTPISKTVADLAAQDKNSQSPQTKEGEAGTSSASTSSAATSAASSFSWSDLSTNIGGAFNKALGFLNSTPQQTISGESEKTTSGQAASGQTVSLPSDLSWMNTSNALNTSATMLTSAASLQLSAAQANSESSGTAESGSGTATLTPEVDTSGLQITGQYTFDAVPEVDTSAISIPPQEVAVKPYVEGEDKVSSLQNQGVTVDVSGDTQSLSATIDAENGKNILTYVDGDASDLSGSITDQDGRTVTTFVHGNASSLQSLINSYDGKTITVNIVGRKLFASGGRTDSPATFAEDGPEWAIPESQGNRSKQLLTSAMEASGFSWRDIYGMYGYDGKSGYAVGGRATKASNFGEDGPEWAIPEEHSANTAALINATREAIGLTWDDVLSSRKDGKKIRKFADGGRATSASVFAEAGAEWAIPEEHSERTAALLNSARQASGFTWGDIIGRFGGLNANPSNSPTTIVYSPTIHANDASGVEQVLQADKKRLDEWFENRKLKDSLEVYQ